MLDSRSVLSGCLLLVSCRGAVPHAGSPSTPTAVAPQAPKSALLAPAPAVPDACTFGGDVESKYRWNVKHRAAASAEPSEVRLPEMFGWGDPANVETPSVRNPTDPDQLLDPHEAEAHVLEGDVWVAKIEDNDCDWHLELSAPNAGSASDRIIAEVSQGRGFAKPRSEIASMVGVDEIRTQCFKFSKPARVRLTGWVFYDGHHWSKKHPRVGWKHGSDFVKTLWELHPVWSVEVLSGGETRGC
jgi:hypothetical protein